MYYNYISTNRGNMHSHCPNLEFWKSPIRKMGIILHNKTLESENKYSAGYEPSGSTRMFWLKKTAGLEIFFCVTGKKKKTCLFIIVNVLFVD